MTAVRADLGPLAVAVAAVLGARCGEARGPGAAGVVLVVGAAGLAGAWFVAGATRVLLAVLAVGLLAGAAMQRALDGLAHHPYAEAAASHLPVRITGTVASEPELGRWSVAVIVRAARLETRGREAGPATTGTDRLVLARAASDDASRFRVLTVGDHVTIDGDAAPLAARDGHLRWRHVAGAVESARLVHVDEPGPLFAAANRAREVIRLGSSLLAPLDAALVQGLVLGDTRLLPDEVVDEFRDAGLSHLLAVSGANVAFVLALWAPLLRRLRVGRRAVAMGAVVAGFVLVTRWEPSVLRAAVMAGCATWSMLAGRPAGSLRLLAYAVTLLVLADPFLIHSAGFALSCSASAGIVLLARRFESCLRLPPPLRAPFAVTLAAQAGVTPVLLATFGDVPLVAPLANVVAAPVAEPVAMLGLPLTVLAGVLTGPAEPLARLLVAPVGVLAAALRSVASVASVLPWRGGPSTAAAAVAAGALVAAGRRMRRS